MGPGAGGAWGVGVRGAGRGRNNEGSTVRPRAPTLKTEEAVDRRQNNHNVRAVSPRHCIANTVLRSSCFNCCF